MSLYPKKRTAIRELLNTWVVDQKYSPEIFMGKIFYIFNNSVVAIRYM